MKRLLVIALGLMLVASLAYAKGFETTKQAGEFQVTVKMDKNPPIVGENKAEIYIKDAAGKAVTDAKVVVEYTMPAMPGMPPMNYKADAKLNGDKYAATLNFSMSGSWGVAIKISRGEKIATAKFNVDVQ